MSTLVKGMKVRVEVGYTEGAPKTVTAVTQANPGVVTSAAHGLAAGSVAYFDSLVGMPQLDGQPIRVDLDGSPSTGSLLTEGVDTTEFDDFTSGNLIPITAWQTLEQSTTYQIGGGAAKTEDASTLLDTIEKLETMKLAAETVTIDLLSYTEDNTALAKIRSVAKAAGKLVFRITLADGAQRVFRGSPSIPGESVSQGSLGKGQLTVTIKGSVCYLVSLTV
jgi:hypothetical protein